MATIPSYEKWMRDTHHMIARRNPRLKRLDAAIQQYDIAPSATNHDLVRDCFNAYVEDHRARKEASGKTWQQSIRNRNFALSNLNRAVNEFDHRQLRPDELAAVEELVRLQQAALAEMFRGKRLRVKYVKGRADADTAMTAMTTAVALTRNAIALRQVGSPPSPSLISKFRSVVVDICGGNVGIANTICKELGLNSLENFVVSATPVLGIIADCSATAIGVVNVGLAYKELWAAQAAVPALRQGDPLEAFIALEVLLRRQIASASLAAATAAAALTAKGLCAMLDLGAASGPGIAIAQALANVVQKVSEAYRDHVEVSKANALLEAGELDFDLFHTCPILGCYFLVVQDHSTIINFAVHDYGTAGFVMDVERMIDRMRPMLESAALLIRASRYEIEGMENYKGIKRAAWDKLGVIDKLVNAPQAAVDTATEGAVGFVQSIKDKLIEMIWGIKAEKEPPIRVDRSRFVGFGSADMFDDTDEPLSASTATRPRSSSVVSAAPAPVNLSQLMSQPSLQASESINLASQASFSSLPGANPAPLISPRTPLRNPLENIRSDVGFDDL